MSAAQRAGVPKLNSVRLPPPLVEIIAEERPADAPRVVASLLARLGAIVGWRRNPWSRQGCLEAAADAIGLDPTLKARLLAEDMKISLAKDAAVLYVDGVEVDLRACFDAAMSREDAARQAAIEAQLRATARAIAAPQRSGEARDVPLWIASVLGDTPVPGTEREISAITFVEGLSATSGAMGSWGERVVDRPDVGIAFFVEGLLAWRKGLEWTRGEREAETFLRDGVARIRDLGRRPDIEAQWDAYLQRLSSGSGLGA